MGYAVCMAPCYGCKRLFMFNPVRVPSVVVAGEKFPICADCVVRVNPLRVANGLPRESVNLRTHGIPEAPCADSVAGVTRPGRAPSTTGSSGSHGPVDPS